MAGLTLTTADAVLKEDYLPGVREQLNNEGFIATVEKNDTDIIEGRRAVLALHLSRNSGVGARAELGALPSAGNQGYHDEYVNLRYNYARIQVSGQTIRAMKSNAGSFVRAVDSEMSGAVNDAKRDISRQCFGTSDGIITTCGLTSSSTTVVLQATVVQARQLEVGMLVDIGSSAITLADTYSVAQARTVNSVTAPAFGTTGGSMVISGAAVSTTAGADFVFRSGSGGNLLVQQELTGLQTIVATVADDAAWVNTAPSRGATTLWNVSSATYPSWASYGDSNSGTLRGVTENMFARAQQNIHIAGGTDIEVWICSDGVHRAYAALLTSLKRFPTTVDLKGGYQGLSNAAGGTMEAPVTWDRDAPNNTAYGLRMKNITEFRASDWEWANEDGAVLQRVIGYDAYEAFLFKYAELTTDKRNAHGYVTDLIED